MDRNDYYGGASSSLNLTQVTVVIVLQALFLSLSSSFFFHFEKFITEKTIICDENRLNLLGNGHFYNKLLAHFFTYTYVVWFFSLRFCFSLLKLCFLLCFIALEAFQRKWQASRKSGLKQRVQRWHDTQGSPFIRWYHSANVIF